MFTMTLEASHAASEKQFREVIACVANVREAWVIAAKDPSANRVRPRASRQREEHASAGGLESHNGEREVSSWKA
jgi:flagellar protein FliS